MAYYILKSYKLSFDALKIFEVLRKEKNCFFLDSSLNSGCLGRYSFFGANPFRILRSSGRDPFKAIREELSRYRLPSPGSGIPFLGGAVGYLSYDLGLVLEKKVKSKFKPGLGIPDAFFGFYNTVIIIDHHRSSLYISSLGLPENKSYSEKLLAEKNFKAVLKLLYKAERAKYPPKNIKAAPLELASNFSKVEYLDAVKRAKEYIRQGDIYQVNLSQQFSAKSKMPAFEIYRRLRSFSPSCFGAYFDAGDFQIISSSPENFLRLNGRSVSTRPMKGTRPRSANPAGDKKLKNSLIRSAKDKAELMMIVDLERNDLGRVCDYGSVRVDKLRELEAYRTVFQSIASVSGKLHKNKDRVDLLRACFPGGSITGCPKIRAMEIIEELEPGRRNIYTGCLGFLSYSGSMDFNILIRSILKKGDQLYFGSGGGIVADSQPRKEYQETLVKAKALMQSIGAL